MKTTLKDVARELNISTAAASRALNDLPGVSDDLRIKVKDTAARLGYKKYLKASMVNAYERSMKFVVVLFGHVGGTLIQQIQNSIDETIRHRGYNELRYMVDPGKELQTESAKEVFFDRLSVEKGVVGVLAFYFRISDVLLSRLQKKKLPVTLIETHTEFGRCVTINQVKAAYKAVCHLAEKGRKRIGCVIPPEQGDPIWRDRLQGYRQALKDKGLPYDPSLIAYADWVGVKPGMRATAALVDQSPEVDAVLYASDTLAAGGMKALNGSGRSIPDDVAVIGFDDEEFDLALTPELSSIRQPIPRMAETGLRLLLDSIEKEDYSHRAIELESELILRASCPG